jgi:hypothetical protein
MAATHQRLFQYEPPMRQTLPK